MREQINLWKFELNIGHRRYEKIVKRAPITFSVFQTSSLFTRDKNYSITHFSETKAL